MNINPFIDLISDIIHIFNWVLFAYIILSWLIAFNVVNRYQPFVARLNDVLTRIVEPLLRPIRRFMPDLGGVDLSPIVLILLLNFLNRVMYSYFYTIG